MSCSVEMLDIKKQRPPAKGARRSLQQAVLLVLLGQSRLEGAQITAHRASPCHRAVEWPGVVRVTHFDVRVPNGVPFEIALNDQVGVGVPVSNRARTWSPNDFLLPSVSLHNLTEGEINTCHDRSGTSENDKGGWNRTHSEYSRHEYLLRLQVYIIIGLARDHRKHYKI